MKKIIAVFFILMLLTGCGEQPVDVEQTAEPTAVPTPVPTEFVPAPLEPAELTQEQWDQMKKTKICITTDGAVDLSNSKLFGCLLRYVDYYGTYQGYTAIRIHNTQWPGTDKEEIAGCTFYYGSYSDTINCRVLLWKDDTFYHLQYAYEQGFLTAEEIKTIAYYNNLCHFEPTVSAAPVPDGPTSMPADFVPQPIEPAELSEDVWIRLENAYQYVVDGELVKGSPVYYRSEFLYYGIYQNYIAVLIYDQSPWGYWLWDEIYLWKDDIFYHFQDALNLGFITDEDAKNIIYYHNVYYYKK